MSDQNYHPQPCPFCGSANTRAREILSSLFDFRTNWAVSCDGSRALALLGWREERARLLFLMALAPQRSFYDLLPLWLIPSGPMQMIVLSIPGWILMSPDPWIMISFAYLPALYFVLRPIIVRAMQRRATPEDVPLPSDHY